MWLIMHLERGGYSHEPTGQSVYWQRSVKNQSAHLCWVICVSDHSDGCAQTFDISFAVRNGFPSYLDGDLVCEGCVCACTRWRAVSVLFLHFAVLFLCLRKRDVAKIRINLMLIIVLLAHLINLSWLAVEMGTFMWWMYCREVAE